MSVLAGNKETVAYSGCLLGKVHYWVSNRSLEHEKSEQLLYKQLLN